LQNNKVRPAIIISNDTVNKTQDCLFAAITSQIKNDNFSFKLDQNDLTIPLQKDCEVRIHKIFTGHQKLIKKSISNLNTNKQKELANLIKKLL
jgi:mRNA interferase MazF